MEVTNPPRGVSTTKPIARARSAARKKYEDLIQGVQVEAYGNIAKARFALMGNSVYPDATFTLRLAFGLVKGFKEDGKEIPAQTTLGGAYGLFDRFKGQDPYRLPETWIEARGKVDPRTPFNFISTADIIGGNSGSPVVNREGRQVGIIFDGNIQSLVLDIVFTEEKARAVSVSSQGILEALRKIYGAGGLAEEMTK